MDKNLIYFCNTCGEMKKITYKYIINKEKMDLHINCLCIKEIKKRGYTIDLFLNNKYKSKPKIKCNSHNIQFTYWCTNCKINICDKCLSRHKNHKIKKLSDILINNNDINLLQKKITNFQLKLVEKKKMIEEKKIFKQKEENGFLDNFQKYYKLNFYEISFVQQMKDFYLYLLENNMICYQIIKNLKYIIEKLNFMFIDNKFSDTLKKRGENNKSEMGEIIDIYNMVFNSPEYCFLPNNEKEEMIKKAEEMQKSLTFERSEILSRDELPEQNEETFFSLMDIPLEETIKLKENLLLPDSTNIYNNRYENNNQFFNYNNNINGINTNDINVNIDSNSLISSESESNYCLFKSKTLMPNKSQQSEKKPIFKGTFKNGKYHGEKCKLIYPNGFIYEGSFKEGLRHGKGTLSYKPNGYFYEGGWAFDKKHGKCKEITKGETFEGFYKNGVREGKCTIKYSNNDRFVGKLLDGKRDGYGELFCSKSNTTYKGEFKNNVYEGKGEIISNNGYYFKGEFLGGLRHGDNCIESKGGFKKYVGSFRRDKMNGKGVFEWYSGESKGDIYNGEFKDDLFEGIGTYKYKDGTIYIGEFLHGIKNGKGKEIYSDGSFYEGEYNEGQQSGKGIFQDFEGNIYDGNFYRGNKHSKGKITFINGEILKGLWLNGNKEGNFYFTDINGNKYLRKYEKDKLIEEKKEGFLSSFINGIFDKVISFIN